MRILITGGLGRVGRAVTEWLKDTHEVAVLDAAAGPLADDRQVYAGSVSDRAAVVRAMTGADAVIHIWNYVDARDVGQAFALALRHEGGPCDVFNIGADDVAADLDSLELIRGYYPDVPAVKNADSFLWKPRAPLFGIARAKQVLGFAPAYTWRDYAAHLDTAPAAP
ncbi:MAG: NAD-dependent epimerase/dehydratase family protein [Dehalococcoidales bacterium]|nr:NAD-dependent epimerase/dehydratase family protein [Dehalococcoidales bacterium]